MTEKYIGVNAFISVLKERQKEFGGCHRAFGKTATYVLEETINKLQSFPTADVTPVIHAHWDCYKCYRFLGWKDGEPEPRWADGKYYHCSRCRRGTVIRENYCPNCGAKMDEETNNGK